MKTKEFEKAIDALNLGIFIDEMKLNHSNVPFVIPTGFKPVTS